MVGHRIQRVASQFVVANQDEQQVQLNSSVDIDDLILASTHLLTL